MVNLVLSGKKKINVNYTIRRWIPCLKKAASIYIYIYYYKTVS